MSSSRIPVALVITELDFGGAEQCLVHIACGLDSSRFAVEVHVLGKPPKAPVDGLLMHLRAAQVPCHFLGLDHIWQLPQAVARLRGQLGGKRRRVVLSFLFHANVVAAMALRGSSNSVLACGIRVADPCRWRQWVERRALRRAAKVVCVSYAVARFAASRLRVDNTRLEVIPNGIDPGSMRDLPPVELASLGVPAQRRALVVVARLTHQKGIDELLQAAGPLLTALPHHDLILVGHGPALPHLRQLATDLGVADRVHFAGWRADVPAILKASDLLLLPSRYEGMPNVVLEAMACRRPVVCTQAEGVCELLGPLSDAQTVPVGDAQAFVNKVLALINEPVQLSQLAAGNQRRAQQYFARNVMIQAYADLLQTLNSGLLQP